MTDVSCRAWSWFVAAEAAGLVSTDALLEGSPLTRAVLEDPTNRVSWDSWARLCDRCGELVPGGLAALEDTADVTLASDLPGELARVAALFVDPMDLYAVGMRWVGPSLYRCLAFRHERLSDGRLEITIEIPEDRAPSVAWMHMVVGALRGIPLYLGLGPALVVPTIAPRRGVFLVKPPVSSTLGSRVTRGLRALAATSTVLDELSYQQRQLTESYDALRRAERGFRDVLDALPVAVAVHRGGRVVHANRSLAGLMRMESHALVGREVTSLVHPADRARVAPRISSPGPTEPVLFRLDVAEPPPAPFVEALALGGLVFDGAPANVLFAIDVTEREAMQRQLAIADRMASIGTLAAGVAHEVNNPLTYVGTNIECALDELDGPPEELPAKVAQLREWLREARDGARRVADIVRDLQTFSRVEPSLPRPVDLHGVLDSAVNISRNAMRHRASIVRDFGPPVHVLADPNRVSQIFVNLLINAAQAIEDGDPEHDEVRIVTRVEGDRVTVEVHDTGVGIDEEVIPSIFDLFFTTKQPGEGTGLGLSICHRLVSELGGTIHVSSTVGRGTCFTVSLPTVDAAEEDHERVGSRVVARPKRSRILIVDDEVGVGRALARVLRHDHEVEVLAAGDQALARLRADPVVDLVLCDLMMPGLTGMDVWETIRREHPALAERFVFITGGAFTERARDFIREARQPLVTKPIDVEELRAIVADQLVETTARGRSA